MKTMESQIEQVSCILDNDSKIICDYIGCDHKVIHDWNDIMWAVRKFTRELLDVGDMDYCISDVVWEHSLSSIYTEDIKSIRGYLADAIRYIDKINIPHYTGYVYRLTAHNIATIDELRDAYKSGIIGCNLSDNAYVYVDSSDVDVNGKILFCTYFFSVDGCYESEVLNEVFERDTMEDVLERVYELLGDPCRIKIKNVFS